MKKKNICLGSNTICKKEESGVKASEQNQKQARPKKKKQEKQKQILPKVTGINKTGWCNETVMVGATLSKRTEGIGEGGAEIKQGQPFGNA